MRVELAAIALLDFRHTTSYTLPPSSPN